MKIRFEPKRRLKRYCKRLPMDTGFDFDISTSHDTKEYRLAGN